MDINTIPPVTSSTSKTKDQVITQIILGLFALMLAYDTTILLSSKNAYNILEIYTLPMLLIVLWGAYFFVFRKLVKKYPQIVYLFLIIIVINASYIYYFNFRHQGIYPSHIVIRDNLQIGDTGDSAHFGIIPENSNETYSNDINVPITLHFPDKTELQSMVTIIPFGTNCDKLLLRLRCAPDSRDFPLIDRYFVLSQAGHYTIDSSDTNLHGASFDVASSDHKISDNNLPKNFNQNTSDILPLPETISVYKKDPFPLVSNWSDHIKIHEMYLSPKPSQGNYLITVNIFRYNLSNNLTNNDLSNFVKGLGFPYEVKVILINGQKVVSAWVNAYGLISPYFPDELGVPVVSWVSNNKIISVTFDRDENSKSFSFNNPSTTNFIKAIHEVYPSTLK